MEQSAPVYPSLQPRAEMYRRTAEIDQLEQQHQLFEDPYYPTSFPSQKTIQIDESIVDTPFDSANRDNVALHRWKDGDKAYDDRKSLSRRYCCCFKSRNGCVVTLTTILLLLGVAIFFLFPRFPVFEIGEPFVNDQNSLRFNVSETNNQAVTAMSYNIAVNFTVNSKNYFDYYTKEIVVTGNLLDQQFRILNNTYGYSKVEGLNFPAQQSTTYTLPFTVYWLSVGLDSKSDPALVEIQRGTLSSPPTTFHIVYRVRVVLPLVSWTGWTLTTSGTLNFNINSATPDQRAQINSVVNQIMGAINGTTVLG